MPSRCAPCLPYLRDHRRTLVVVAVLSLLGSVTTLAQPLLTRNVLDGLQAPQAVGRTVALLVVVLAAVALLNALRDFLLQRTAEGLVLTARRRLTRHLLRLPIAEYDQRRTGDLLSRVGADTTLLRAVVTSGLFETVTGAVMVVGAATAMLLLDPILFLTAGRPGPRPVRRGDLLPPGPARVGGGAGPHRRHDQRRGAGPAAARTIRAEQRRGRARPRPWGQRRGGVPGGRADRPAAGARRPGQHRRDPGLVPAAARRRRRPRRQRHDHRR